MTTQEFNAVFEHTVQMCRGKIKEIERNEYVRQTRIYAGHKIAPDWVPAPPEENK
jgi:hypothetical protein